MAPLKDWSLKSTWDECYSIGIEPEGRPANRAEVRLNYHRATMLPYCRNRAAGLQAIFQWPLTTRICVIGAGFSWLPEAFEELGYTAIVGCDVSSYIQGTKNAPEDAEIDAAIQAVGLNPASGEGAQVRASIVAKGKGPGPRTRASKGAMNDNLRSAASRNRIRNAIGGDPEVVLTESVAESLTDAECVTYSGEIHSLVPAALLIHFIVVHWNEGHVTGFNEKTLAEWKALLPNDTFIADGTFEVM